MQGHHDPQQSFHAGIYELVIPSDHLLRKIADTVDFDFVGELVSDAYCADNGRPSWDPVVLFKVVFLQFLYDLSDRQVEEQVNFHLACKWFVGLQPEETAPDHTVLCRFRSRLGAETFQEIFNQIVHQAREAGLVDEKLQIIDATHLKAKVDLFRLPPPPPESPSAKAPGSPDPDARFGRKSDATGFYGYKEHMGTDAATGIITGLKVTPGNVADSQVFSGLVDPQAREVTADKGYDTNANHRYLLRHGQRSSIIIKNNRVDPQIIGRADPQSQRKRPNIERKFAEQKQYHGLAKARYWGLGKVTIQALMSAIVVNCKRIANLLHPPNRQTQAPLCATSA